MMTGLLIFLIFLGQTAGLNGLTMWTSPENKAPIFVMYGILLTVQAMAIAILMK
jgi:hypothetical protein